MALGGCPRQSYVPFVLALPQRKPLIAWFKNKQATGVGWNRKKLAGKMKSFKKKTHLKLPKGWTPMTFLKACHLPHSVKDEVIQSHDCATSDLQAKLTLAIDVSFFN